ncbi:hypothetical protein [Chamaesiphon minutus]|uniref:hypothetical protein n=1 Tax=Chamaesiphon minutus TaxID=1173032 RepID=UPI001E34B96E|nr:hypothetical protein [Chamaesiphon minutus]
MCTFIVNGLTVPLKMLLSTPWFTISKTQSLGVQKTSDSHLHNCFDRVFNFSSTID